MVWMVQKGKNTVFTCDQSIGRFTHLVGRGLGWKVRVDRRRRSVDEGWGGGG